MNPVAALLFVITFINLFLSTLIFFRNIKSSVHKSLALFIFLVALWTFSMGMLYQGSINQAYFWIKWVYVAGVVIANTLVYFALVFPENTPLPLLHRFWVYLPAIPLVVSILFIPGFLFKEIVEYNWWKDVKLGTPEYILYTIYFVLVYFGALIVVWKKYQLYRGITRLQLLYVFYAILIAGTFGAFFDLVFPWINLYQYIWLGPIGTLIMIGLLIWATAKHSLMDLRFVVARTVAYTLIIALVGTLYAVLFFTLFTILLPEYKRYELFFYVALTLVLMYTFQYIRGWISRLTEQVFFKDKYDSNDLLTKLTEIMASTLRLDSLTRKTLTLLLETIHINSGAFLLFQEGRGLWVIAEGYKSLPTFQLSDAQFLYQQGRTALLDEEPHSPLQELMRQMDISVSAPLAVGEEEIGVLVLRGKKSGDIYTSQDVSVLKIFGSEVAVAIQNAEAYEEISKFNVTLMQEVENATRELRFANEKLKEVDALKDEFVSVAGHELRTPMTAIKLYLWMVLQKYAKTLPEKQKLYLNRAYLSTERLIKLVNDLLNVSRIESGRIQLEKEPVNIERVVADVISEFQHQATQDKLKVFVQRPPQLLPEVFVDPNRIKEVLVNLVGNAFKFTPEGGTIKISFEEKKGFVLVLVTDTGKGIAKSDLPKLFRKFGMLESSSPRGEGQKGTGLGLYISRQIISLHGGQIWAESPASPAGGEQGKGTIFTFTLPVYKKSAATSSSQIPQPEEQIGQAQVLQQA